MPVSDKNVCDLQDSFVTQFQLLALFIDMLKALKILQKCVFKKHYFCIYYVFSLKSIENLKKNLSK